MLQRLGIAGPEQCQGLKCFKCVHGADSPPSFCPHTLTLSDGLEHVAEVHEERLGGDYFVSTTPIYDNRGRMTGTVHVARDITERKRMEKDILQKAEDLARSNADLQQFAYVASHDLQEPLRTVTNYLSLLDRRYGDQLDDRGKEYVRVAIDGGSRAVELIRNLLDYSRIDSRAKPMEPTDMEEVLRTVLDNLQFQVRDEKASVTHDPLPTILADEGQMAALMQNLISNAIKFHGPDDPIVHISCKENDGKLLFAVRDNGIGIDPRHNEQIFQLFKRLHTMDKYPGTGIGLAIAKKIVERHGGLIWLESELNKGTTFFFTVPLGIQVGRAMAR
jgi:light-regulated signal transduction histidine kinase (bacteriophytochrome)